MSGLWSRNGRAWGDASALFERTAQADAILSNDALAIGPADLAAFIRDRSHHRAVEIEAALRSNAGLRSDFDHLLRRLASHSLPRLAAASSGAVTTRTAEGCRILMRPSRADPAQVYVIIELDDPAAAPGALFACTRGTVVCHPLPPFGDGRVQLLAEVGSDLISTLRDVDAEIFLR